MRERISIYQVSHSFKEISISLLVNDKAKLK
jgi:hypothetical protein